MALQGTEVPASLPWALEPVPWDPAFLCVGWRLRLIESLKLSQGKTFLFGVSFQEFKNFKKKQRKNEPKHKQTKRTKTKNQESVSAAATAAAAAAATAAAAAAATAAEAHSSG